MWGVGVEVVGVVEGAVLHGGSEHDHGEGPEPGGGAVQGYCSLPSQVCPCVQLGREAGQVSLINTADTAGPPLGETYLEEDNLRWMLTWRAVSPATRQSEV